MSAAVTSAILGGAALASFACGLLLGGLGFDQWQSRRAGRALQQRVARLGTSGEAVVAGYGRDRAVERLIGFARSLQDEQTGNEGKRTCTTSLLSRLGARPVPGRSALGDGDEADAYDRRLVRLAGLSEDLDVGALAHVRAYGAGLGAAVCGSVGLLINPWLLPVGAVIGAFMGRRWPTHTLEHAVRCRKLRNERELPMLLDIVVLCLQAGLSFDSAIEMYCSRFDTELSHDCRRACLRYQQGMQTRAEAFGQLAHEVDLEMFSRFVETSMQALEFGAPLKTILGELAEDVRKDYRARAEERVAKAPVKMLIPTGVLILPAMLLLVLGPVVLSIATELF